MKENRGEHMSKRREVFLSILGNCYTTLDAKLFEEAATLFHGYVENVCNFMHLLKKHGLA